MKHRCTHIYANMTLCQSRDLYAYSCNCKRHWNDINVDKPESKIQLKRLRLLRKIVKQIRDEAGFSI